MAQTKIAAKPATQPVVVRAKVALDWLNGIVNEHLSGRLAFEDFQRRMREAHDSIKADGLTDEVSALWRLDTYGRR